MAAGDRWARTEPPTEKRKKKAREEGQVARSLDVGAWAAMLAGSLLAPFMISEARARVLGITSNVARVASHPTSAGALEVVGSALGQFLSYVAVIGGAFMALALAVGVLQVGRSFSLKAARPRFLRVNPVAGLKRRFAVQALWELVKQVLKLAVLGVLGYFFLHSLMLTAASKSPVTLAPLLDYAGSSILGFVRTASVLGIALGAADYAVQRHRHNQSLKMTKQEVRDEHKQHTGDPHMRAHMRRRQYSIARSRTIASVRTADVVVTNPTHIAVALQYDPARANAPRLVAKGTDLLAQRIKEEASRCGIPVVEDPPLARYLHATCEVDDVVPEAIYLAVAQLLAFVYRMPKSLRGIGVHSRPPSDVPKLDEDVRSREERQRRGERRAA
jgi:flagellar biosynthetic protein FlhB